MADVNWGLDAAGHKIWCYPELHIHACDKPKECALLSAVDCEIAEFYNLLILEGLYLNEPS